MTKLKGQCLCGDVKFKAKTDKLFAKACHCGTCRKLNSGPYLSVGVQSGIVFTKQDGLKWYDSSEWATRGFCSTCGASLFYHLKGTDFYSVSTGCLTLPESMNFEVEYFIDEKPNFYEFSGDRVRLTGAETFAAFQESNDDD